MTRDDLQRLVADIQQRQSELEHLLPDESLR
jgi:hypothetical protein